MKRNALLFFVLTYATSLFAANQVWNVDPSHSSFNFAVDHMVISETNGKFSKYELDVKADKADFTDAEFTVTVHLDSVNTDDAKRDEHLKGKDFFNVEKNPLMTFTGKKFTKNKNGTYTVSGSLTLNGVTKDLKFDAKFNGIMKDPWGNTRAGLKVSGVINREDFGLKYNSVLDNGGLAIGKEVRISVNLELIKNQSAPAEKKKA